MKLKGSLQKCSMHATCSHYEMHVSFKDDIPIYERSKGILNGAETQCTHTKPQQPVLFLRKPVNPVTFE